MFLIFRLVFAHLKELIASFCQPKKSAPISRFHVRTVAKNNARNGQMTTTIDALRPENWAQNDEALLMLTSTTKSADERTTTKKAKGNIKLTVVTKDASNNRRLGQVEVSFSTQNGTQKKGTGKSDDNGVVLVENLEANQAVAFEAKRRGFADLKNVVIELDARPQQQAMLSMSRKLKRGLTKRVVLNWGPKPLDLDLKVVKLKKNEQIECIAYWNNKENCKGLRLDVDNRRGGQNGAETITWNDELPDNQFIIFVQDFSREADSPLEVSNARVAIYGPKAGEVVEMPVPKKKPAKRAKFWVIGCIMGKAGVDTFSKVDELTNRDPRKKGKEMCKS